MQGYFAWAFSGKKADILKVETVYKELAGDQTEGFDVIKTECFDDLAEDAMTQMIVRSNQSVNIRFGEWNFPEMVSRVPKVEAGCWSASDEVISECRDCVYSKAGAKRRKS